jgi:hypothetical protein
MVPGKLIRCKEENQMTTTIPRSQLIRRLGWLFLTFVAMSLPASATTYYAKPTAATVVDAETGEPLEGVNVVAHWAVLSVTGRGAGDLELTEAVTDKDGKFYIPGWGPKSLDSDLPRGSRLGKDAPALTFFKSGYLVRSVGNNLQPLHLSDPSDTGPSVRYSDWEGKTIKLEKFKGDLERYASAAERAPGSMNQAIPCGWKRVPRVYVALMKEKERLDRLGVRNYLPSMGHMELYFKNAKCGSAKEFFKEYMK